MADPKMILFQNGIPITEATACSTPFEANIEMWPQTEMQHWCIKDAKPSQIFQQLREGFHAEGEAKIESIKVKKNKVTFSYNIDLSNGLNIKMRSKNELPLKEGDIIDIEVLLK